MSQCLRVVTLNLLCENRSDRVGRARDAARILKSGKVDFDILCLQECVTNDVKYVLKYAFSDPEYVIIESNHHRPRFPRLAYIPCVALGALAIERYMYGQSAALFIFLAFVSMLLYPACLFRMVIRFALGCPGPFDMMGQTLIFRRRGIYAPCEPKILLNKPFKASIRGYPLPKSIVDAVKYFGQHCFARPGRLIVRFGDLLIVTAHLVVSQQGTTKNPHRETQVRTILKDIRHIEQTTFSPKMVVCAGDFNAPLEFGASEVDLMQSLGGFSRPTGPLVTWDPVSNPLTENTHEGVSQLDYIFSKPGSYVSSGILFDGRNGPIVSDHYGIALEIKY